MISPASFPPAVRPGDRVGVAALSGPARPDRLARGLDALRELGFEPVLARNLALEQQSHDGLFAGSDTDRLDAFHELAADESVRAIFFARGGHGLLRVLPKVDWDLLRSRPRAYVGYSDLTPFLLQAVRRLGIAAFHGPMVAADLARGLTEAERASLLAALSGTPLPILPLAGFVREGGAEGLLLGGCLSLLVATLGTEFAVDAAGALLVWEDTNEPLYRVDRMLTHLGLSGTLSRVQGMVMGSCPSPGSDPGPAAPPGVIASLGEHAQAVPGPVAWGLPMGHRAPNWTLPFGRLARLDSATLELALR